MPKYEQLLGCEGYFGFGGGYAAARDGKLGDSYCNHCPLRETCFLLHAERVRDMFPSIAIALDVLGADTGLAGGELLSEFRRRFASEHDPLTSVMRGNIEDGLRVGEGGSVRDRNRFTLPFPFRADQRA